MTLTDTHCHLYLDKFDEDLGQVLDRAYEAGIREIYLPAIDWSSLEQMDKLSHPHIRFHKMAGVHPCEVEKNWPVDADRLAELLSGEEYIAVGETGLDYYWSRDHIDRQKESLSIHCGLAKKLEKPIVLHNRNSTADLLDLIESEQDGALRGVWHCFSGTLEEANRALDLGLYLGIGGILTFKNSKLDQVVAQLPKERLILETDAPFLAPDPKRGKRNEPAYMLYTARKLAEVMGESLEETARITTRNATELFRPN